ncbi:glycosyltransferase family 4 protein [Pontibacter sp. H249]|uniref:glycosyltransferase family 4 protein n=1 Tax=Pontibacter sp. H249 TaxID=3133420 RepID=UPI0030C0A733
MNVLFIVPYPVGRAASQRFRVEQFLPYLQATGISYKLVPFWSRDTFAILYKGGNILRKIAGTLQGFLQRVALVLQLQQYDYIFIHREATPVGPPWFEWLAAKVFKVKLIFDFDDAIWLENTSAENQKASTYKQHHKIAKVCTWGYKISAGNRYLQEYAQQFNEQSVYLPTTINLAKYNRLKNQETERVVIGWIGSHSTLPYLKLIEPVLQQLEQQYTFDFVVIADREPDLTLKSLKFVRWREEVEVENLLQLNIGVMPLPETEWAKGKCAFKALQYMALGIPAVVSAVGANIAAVPHGNVGYTCTTERDWYKSLERLLLNIELRSRMGADGREWVAEKYSLTTHQHTFLNLFN